MALETGVPEDGTPAASPWAELTANGEAALLDYVERQVMQRLPEAQAGLDGDQLLAFMESPAQAPALSGRAVERLFDLAVVELARGHLDRSEAIVKLVRARARNRNSAYAGTTLLAEIERRRAGDDGERQQEAIAEVLRGLPRARFGSATVIFQLFQAQEQLTARVEQLQQQMLSLETASSALFYGQVLPGIVDARPRFLAAIETVREEHEARPSDQPYAFSTVDLRRARDARPVRMAVWDLGTNPELFRDQLFQNEQERINGEDDDGNGQIDDVHGIVSDASAPHTALLYSPSPDTLERYTPFLRGIMDLRAGIASSAAAEQVLELLRSVTDAAALEALERNLDDIGEWAHGTHVAGIMVAGNPHARLAIFRSAWAGEVRTYYHRGPTDDELAAERRNVEAIAEFITRHRIRVVNASIGFSKDYVEAQLRHEGDRYGSAEEVTARAEAIHQHRTESWSLVFARCPDTLFVVAAGNANRDIGEYGEVPASLAAENVLVVGAVDRFGGWATFTNSGDRVRIFDHGVEVDSLLPSGDRVPLSGTSMASPNLANLAGKMLAVSPGLTPAQVVEIIFETGDAIAEPFGGRIANERRAIAQARRRGAAR